MTPESLKIQKAAAEVLRIAVLWERSLLAGRNINGTLAAAVRVYQEALLTANLSPSVQSK